MKYSFESASCNVCGKEFKNEHQAKNNLTDTLGIPINGAGSIIVQLTCYTLNNAMICSRCIQRIYDALEKEFGKC